MSTFKTFTDVLARAIADFEQFGFDSPERLDRWRQELEQAAGGHTTITAENLRRTLTSIYTAQVTNGGLLKIHKIPQWRLNQLAPILQRELDRRMMASAQLIRLNREEMIAKTIRRFSGWATSIPDGGSKAVDKKDTKDEVKKALKSLPYEERRVMIDQAAKFKAQLSDTVATNTGAIAAEWKSHFRAPGYNFRPDHKARDGVVYVIRNNWAMDKGLMKPAGHQFTDEITMPAEEVYCSCKYRYIYNLRELPDEMLTDAGRATIKRK